MTIAEENLFGDSFMNTNWSTRINQIDDEKFYGSGSSLRPDVEVQLMFFVIFMEEFEIGVISCNLKKMFLSTLNPYRILLIYKTRFRVLLRPKFVSVICQYGPYYMGQDLLFC